MEKFKNSFNNQYVLEANKLVSEYLVYVDHSVIGPYEIGLKIFKNLKGNYSYSLSHHYQGSNQAGPYISSRNDGFQNEEDALEGAKHEMFSFYDFEDPNAQWIKSSSYHL